MKQIEIAVSPAEAANQELYIATACKKAGVNCNDVAHSRIIHKSLDARGREIIVNLTVALYSHGEIPENISEKYNYRPVDGNKTCVVVGSGPAGLFAALRLIELGVKPIVIERGKDVHSRRRDIALLSTQQILDPESNYCYGEGGAGTFSDGKLYTRSNKRGDISRILEIFHLHGAAEDILYESRPHIGSDKLPRIVEAMRNTIIRCGGEVRFQTKLTDINIEGGRVKSIIVNQNEELETQRLILATGHSAEDVYTMLQKNGIALEAKGFAMGVRVEHPRDLIDEIRYKKADTTYLPAAAYNVAAQVDGRGVYSFCMCPGGQVVPSSTLPGYTCVNGMSAAARNNYWSNAAIVVEIRPEDIPDINTGNPMAGFNWQKELERITCVNGGGNQSVAAQRLTDFVKGRISTSLPQSSYVPGIINSPVHFWMPEFISNRLREGFKQFDKKMHGFMTEEGLVISSETRTSSPVRIIRDTEKLCCPNVSNLFACGEGAGYAGGIVSSAMDGEKAAESASICS
ncbi:MAG: FAD-dependent oxidoreductase [Bacteroidales bacterium]|nr:FAD-dependent oxidoreductase [Bacteroidales bacterium]